MINDFFETVPYNHPSFPIFICRETFFAAKHSTSHINWHSDIEFVKIISGSINYSVNGEIVKLSEGQCLYINANQIHYSYSSDEEDCVFLCVIFHPSFLCSKKSFEEKYVLPILSNASVPFCIFNSDVQGETAISEGIQRIYDERSSSSFELQLHSSFFNMWSYIYKALCKDKKTPPADNEAVISFKRMLSYIQNHYREKVTLQDICSAGNVCKTTCNRIFRTYTGRTPVEYLTDYRLRRAVEIIENENSTLTRICYECGFSSASYFAETFKKAFGVSPKKYKST